MSVFDVSLEVDTSGACMAHVLDLPGCCACAGGQESALAALPDAIRAYYGWLRRHGEDVPTPAAIEFRVVETSASFGLFACGDRAALFAYDRAPLSRPDLEVYLRRVAYARADLLALVRDLPNHILDWRADTLTIREILRHVGNTEQFYVSRLVDPATLRPEWAGDEHMPIFTFLELQLRTVVQRLLGLTDDELAATTYQTRWTEHPDEPWSARKALRRLLEHERKHIDQVRAILADWRRQLLARMAAERAALLWSLVGLDEATLTQATVFDQLTVKDLLAHIAAWDELFAERAELILNRQSSEIISVDLSRNDAVYAERRRWSFAQAAAAFTAARATFLAAIDRASEEDLHLIRRFSWGRRSIRVWSEWRSKHDAAHARDLAHWIKRQRPAKATGPQSVLLAALQAARDELLAAAALIPAEERATRPVCGRWTLKDLLGHQADWEAFCVAGLRLMVAGQPPDLGWNGGLEEWNQAHFAARQAQSWAQVWSDLHATRQELMAILSALSQDELIRSFPSPRIVTPDASPYSWVLIWLEHDREHAAALRAGLGLPWPKRLLHFATSY